jgi:hypothetical protein
MLDFYAFTDLDPWPEDVPSSARYLGSLDIDDFELVSDAFKYSLGEIASYFDDWVLEGRQIPVVVAVFEHLADQSGASVEVVLKVIEMLRAADGLDIIAICD